MKVISVRRGYYERFTQRDQHVISLSKGRGVLVVNPGAVAVVDADDMELGSVYVNDLTLRHALAVHAEEVDWEGEELTPSDVGRIGRLVARHLRRYRYAVDCRQYGYGGGVPPEASTPLAVSLKDARAMLTDFGRRRAPITGGSRARSG